MLENKFVRELPAFDPKSVLWLALLENRGPENKDDPSVAGFENRELKVSFFSVFSFSFSFSSVFKSSFFSV